MATFNVYAQFDYRMFVFKPLDYDAFYTDTVSTPSRIDWTDSFGGLGPQPGHVVIESEATTLLTKAGFTCERTFPAGEHHYGIACRKN